MCSKPLRFLLITIVLLPAVAARADEAPSFQDEGAAGRFARLLDLIENGPTMQVIDRDQWSSLVVAHREAIERTQTHRGFAKAVNELFDAVGISHFSYFTDRQWEYWFLLSAFGRKDPRYEVATIGVWPQRIDGRWFVRGILEGGPADSTRLSVGDELISVDGQPYEPVVSLRGKAGEPTRIRVRRKPGLIYNISVTPVKKSLFMQAENATLRSIKTIEHQGLRFAYAHVWTLLGTGTEYRLLAEMQPEVSGLLLDFRDGFGGWPDAARAFLTDRASDAKRPGQTSAWEKPVVILTDDGTRSAKELVVSAAREAGRATLVGSPTPGEVAGVRSFPRVGSDGLLMMPCYRFSLEGRPTLPDVAVDRTLPYCAGADPQLRVAKRVLVDLVRTAQGIARDDANQVHSGHAAPAIVAD